MGASQSIPVVGEAVTVIDSGVKLAAAGSCALAGAILDDQEAKNAGKKFVEDAGNSWVEYSERNVIAAPIRAVVHSIDDDKVEAKRIMIKMGKSVEQVVDSTPVVGHVKGVAHYIAGDKERGDDCMKGATRTLAVVGAGALTGGVGGGLVLGGLASASSGVVYDGVVTGIESGVKHKVCPYGVVRAIEGAVESGEKKDGYGVIKSVIDIGYNVGGEFNTGISKELKITTKIRKARERKAKKSHVVEITSESGTALKNETAIEMHVDIEPRVDCAGYHAFNKKRRCDHCMQYTLILRELIIRHRIEPTAQAGVME